MRDLIVEEAVKLGYSVFAASPFEWGLVKNNQGIRTWFKHSFEPKWQGKQPPPLSHTMIIQSILVQEGVVT